MADIQIKPGQVWEATDGSREVRYVDEVHPSRVTYHCGPNHYAETDLSFWEKWAVRARAVVRPRTP